MDKDLSHDLRKKVLEGSTNVFKRKTPTGTRSKHLAKRGAMPSGGISIREPPAAPAVSSQPAAAAQSSRKGKAIAPDVPPPAAAPSNAPRRFPSLKKPVRDRNHQRQVINYKGKASAVRKAREGVSRHGQKQAFDFRFWTNFHQDFYESVILSRKTPVTPMQWVDWDYMANANDETFDLVIEVCQRAGVRRIMEFQRDWNHELICQFYATLTVIPGSSNFEWMIEGTWMHASASQFAAILGFSAAELADKDDLHMENALGHEQINFLYEEDAAFEPGETKGMRPVFANLNRLFRKTLHPKEGDASHVLSYTRNLLRRMQDGQPAFNVFLFIWKEIRLTSQDPKRSCSYAPFIMALIEHTAQRAFLCDAKHTKLQIRAVKASVPAQRQSSQRRSSASTSAPTPSVPESASTASSSTILSAVKAIFGMCATQAVEIRKMKNNQKKILRKLELECSDDEPEDLVFTDPFSVPAAQSESDSDEYAETASGSASEDSS